MMHIIINKIEIRNTHDTKEDFRVWEKNCLNFNSISKFDLEGNFN